MPPPVVYVVVAFAVFGVGIALYQIFTSDRVPSQRQRRRRREENGRRLAPPHGANAPAPGDSSENISTHEMRELRQPNSQSGLPAGRNLPPSTGLRNRRSNTSRNAQDPASSTAGLMDGPSDNNIPISPLSPEPNPWSSSQASHLRSSLGDQPEAPSDTAPRKSEQSRLSGSNEVLFDAADSSHIVTPTRSPAQSPFELGSESPSASPRTDDILLRESSSSSSSSALPAATTSSIIAIGQSPFDDTSEPSTPRSTSLELSASDVSPSRATGPRIQLPTPSDSEVEMSSSGSPVMRGDIEWTAVSPPAFRNAQLHSFSPSTNNTPLPQMLSADVLAPPISRTATDMSASFFTAQSPASEFRSFPPTEPTSPFSESLTFSGDEDMYSLPSQADSEESLPVFGMPEEEMHRGDGLMFVVGGSRGIAAQGQGREELSDSPSDSSDDGSSGGTSDESWSEFSAPPTSPRH